MTALGQPDVKKRIRIILIVCLSFLIVWNLSSMVVTAAGLVDEANEYDGVHEYTKYKIERYQLDYKSEEGSGFGGKIMAQITNAGHFIANMIWYFSMLISTGTGYLVQEAFALDFIAKVADKLGGNIQTLAGVSLSGFDTDGFYPRMLFILVFLLGIYVTYTGLIKRETTKAFKAVINFLIIFVVSVSCIAFAPDYIKKINDFSSDFSNAALDVGIKFVSAESGADKKADTKQGDKKDGTEKEYRSRSQAQKQEDRKTENSALIRDCLFGIQIKTPWLLLQFGDTDFNAIEAEDKNTDDKYTRVEAILKQDYSVRNEESDEVIQKYETNASQYDNKYMTGSHVGIRLAMVLFLLIFNLLISVFVIMLCGMMLLSQIFFMLFAMVLPVTFLLGMIPGFDGMVKKAVVTLFNTILLRSGLTLILCVTFSISMILYNMAADEPFFLIAFMQILLFAGVFVKLNEILGFVSLPGGGGDTSTARRMMGMPMRGARRSLNKMGRGLKKIAQPKRSRGGKSLPDTGGSSVPHDFAEKPDFEKKPPQAKKPFSERAGKKLAGVADMKRNLQGKVQDAKDTVKNAPDNIRHGVYSKRKQFEDGVGNFKQQFHDSVGDREAERVQRHQEKEEGMTRKRMEMNGYSGGVVSSGNADEKQYAAFSYSPDKKPKTPDLSAPSYRKFRMNPAKTEKGKPERK